jgi:hypothetical protein
MYIGHYVKFPLFLSDFNETWIFLNSFSKKYSNIKFHENPSSESRVVPCGRRDGQICKRNNRFSKFCGSAYKAYFLSIIFYLMLLPKLFSYYMVYLMPWKEKLRQYSTEADWFQATAAKYMRTALLWATTQRVVAIYNRRFGTTYR